MRTRRDIAVHLYRPNDEPMSRFLACGKLPQPHWLVTKEWRHVTCRRCYRNVSLTTCDVPPWLIDGVGDYKGPPEVQQRFRNGK